MTSRKALLAMKSRYHKVTGCGMHSDDVVSREEDVSALDALC